MGLLDWFQSLDQGLEEEPAWKRYAKMGTRAAGDVYGAARYNPVSEGAIGAVGEISRQVSRPSNWLARSVARLEGLETIPDDMTMGGMLSQSIFGNPVEKNADIQIPLTPMGGPRIPADWVPGYEYVRKAGEAGATMAGDLLADPTAIAGTVVTGGMVAPYLGLGARATSGAGQLERLLMASQIGVGKVSAADQMVDAVKSYEESGFSPETFGKGFGSVLSGTMASLGESGLKAARGLNDVPAFGVKARAEVPQGLTRVFRSGDGSFFTTNEARAGSHDGRGSYVDIPTERVGEFNAEAAKHGQPTPQDVFLPDEYVRQARPTELKKEVFDVAEDADSNALLDSLGVKRNLPDVESFGPQTGAVRTSGWGDTAGRLAEDVLSLNVPGPASILSRMAGRRKVPPKNFDRAKLPDDGKAEFDDIQLNLEHIKDEFKKGNLDKPSFEKANAKLIQKQIDLAHRYKSELSESVKPKEHLYEEELASPDTYRARIAEIPELIKSGKLSDFAAKVVKEGFEEKLAKALATEAAKTAPRLVAKPAETTPSTVAPEAPVRPVETSPEAAKAETATPQTEPPVEAPRAPETPSETVPEGREPLKFHEKTSFKEFIESKGHVWDDFINRKVSKNTADELRAEFQARKAGKEYVKPEPKPETVPVRKFDKMGEELISENDATATEKGLADVDDLEAALAEADKKLPPVQALKPVTKAVPKQNTLASKGADLAKAQKAAAEAKPGQVGYKPNPLFRVELEDGNTVSVRAVDKAGAQKIVADQGHPVKAVHTPQEWNVSKQIADQKKAAAEVKPEPKKSKTKIAKKVYHVKVKGIDKPIKVKAVSKRNAGIALEGKGKTVEGIYDPTELQIYTQERKAAKSSGGGKPPGGDPPSANEAANSPDPPERGLLSTAIQELAAFPRAVKSSWDLSAPLRQGVFYALNPLHAKETGRAVKAMMRSLKESNFLEIDKEIRGRENFEVAKDAGLQHSDPHELGKKEEFFMSKFADKIPGVKMSERAYTTYLNKVRADAFDNMAAPIIKEMKAARDKLGEVTKKDEAAAMKPYREHLKAIAEYVNNATGVGDFGGITRSNLIRTVLYSPKFMSSRLNLLTQTFRPEFWRKLPPSARKQVLKDYAGYAAGVTTALGLAQLAGASVETDPASPDFLKAKFGNTRLDLSGGLQPYFRYAYSSVAGRKKSTSGREYVVDRPWRKGKKEGQGKFDIGREAWMFGRSKLAPVPALVADMIDQKNLLGESITGQSEIGKALGLPNVSKFERPLENLVAPMWPVDVAESFNVKGGRPELVIGGGLFGLGTQTYNPKSRKTGRPRKETGPYVAPFR